MDFRMLAVWVLGPIWLSLAEAQLNVFEGFQIPMSPVPDYTFNHGLFAYPPGYYPLYGDQPFRDFLTYSGYGGSQPAVPLIAYGANTAETGGEGGHAGHPNEHPGPFRHHPQQRPPQSPQGSPPILPHPGMNNNAGGGMKVGQSRPIGVHAPAPRDIILNSGSGSPTNPRLNQYDENTPQEYLPHPANEVFHENPQLPVGFGHEDLDKGGIFYETPIYEPGQREPKDNKPFLNDVQSNSDLKFEQHHDDPHNHNPDSNNNYDRQPRPNNPEHLSPNHAPDTLASQAGPVYQPHQPLPSTPHPIAPPSGEHLHNSYPPDTIPAAAVHNSVHIPHNPDNHQRLKRPEVIRPYQHPGMYLPSQQLHTEKPDFGFQDNSVFGGLSPGFSDPFQARPFLHSDILDYNMLASSSFGKPMFPIPPDFAHGVNSPQFHSLYPPQGPTGPYPPAVQFNNNNFPQHPQQTQSPHHFSGQPINPHNPPDYPFTHNQHPGRDPISIQSQNSPGYPGRDQYDHHQTGPVPPVRGRPQISTPDHPGQRLNSAYHPHPGHPHVPHPPPNLHVQPPVAQHASGHEQPIHPHDQMRHPTVHGHYDAEESSTDNGFKPIVQNQLGYNQQNQNHASYVDPSTQNQGHYSSPSVQDVRYSQPNLLSQKPADNPESQFQTSNQNSFATSKFQSTSQGRYPPPQTHISNQNSFLSQQVQPPSHNSYNQHQPPSQGGYPLPQTQSSGQINNPGHQAQSSSQVKYPSQQFQSAQNRYPSPQIKTSSQKNYPLSQTQLTGQNIYPPSQTQLASYHPSPGQSVNQNIRPATQIQLPSQTSYSSSQIRPLSQNRYPSSQTQFINQNRYPSSQIQSPTQNSYLTSQTQLPSQNNYLPPQVASVNPNKYIPPKVIASQTTYPSPQSQSSNFRGISLSHGQQSPHKNYPASHFQPVKQNSYASLPSQIPPQYPSNSQSEYPTVRYSQPDPIRNTGSSYQGQTKDQSSDNGPNSNTRTLGSDGAYSGIQYSSSAESAANQQPQIAVENSKVTEYPSKSSQAYSEAVSYSTKEQTYYPGLSLNDEIGYRSSLQSDGKSSQTEREEYSTSKDDSINPAPVYPGKDSSESQSTSKESQSYESQDSTYYYPFQPPTEKQLYPSGYGVKLSPEIATSSPLADSSQKEEEFQYATNATTEGRSEKSLSTPQIEYSPQLDEDGSNQGALRIVPANVVSNSNLYEEFIRTIQEFTSPSKVSEYPLQKEEPEGNAASDTPIETSFGSWESSSRYHDPIPAPSSGEVEYKNELDDTPACARYTNATFCLEDPEYPMEEIRSSIDNNRHPLHHFVIDITPLPSNAGEEDPANPSQRGTEGSSSIIGVAPTAVRNITEVFTAGTCDSSLYYARPLRAVNTNGQWKVIVNVEDEWKGANYTQTVLMEECNHQESLCSSNEPVSAKCVQKFKMHRLLAWEKEKGFFIDAFILPFTCSCQLLEDKSAS